MDNSLLKETCFLATNIFSANCVPPYAAAAPRIVVDLVEELHKGLKSPKRFTNLPLWSLSSILN